MSKAMQELERIAALPDDWDGEGAPAISPRAVERARTIVASEGTTEPHVSPGVNAQVHLYWWIGGGADGVRMEAEVTPEGGVEMMFTAREKKDDGSVALGFVFVDVPAEGPPGPAGGVVNGQLPLEDT